MPARRRARPVAVTVALVLGAAVGLGACSSSGTTATSTGATGAPSTSALAGSSTSTTAPSGPARVQKVSSPYGEVLGRGDGKVLYAWDKEADGTIACTDAACLEKWPPFLAEGGQFTVDGSLAGLAVTVVDRPEGTKQVAIDGHPVYTMAIDKPGEANCQGSDGWWLVNLDGSSNQNRTPTAKAGASTSSTAGASNSFGTSSTSSTSSPTTSKASTTTSGSSSGYGY